MFLWMTIPVKEGGCGHMGFHFSFGGGCGHPFGLFRVIIRKQEARETPAVWPVGELQNAAFRMYRS